MQLHVAGHGAAQFALEGGYAARLAVIGTGPDLQLVARTNQLRRDPQLVPLGLERALEQIFNGEFCAYRGERFRRALVGHHRGSANHAEVLGVDVAKCRDDFLGEAIGEVFAFGSELRFSNGSTASRVRTPVSAGAATVSTGATKR